MVDLSTLISYHARYRPDATAVVFEDERLSYRDFGARVARCANMLRSLGVERGDRVATVLENCPEILELYWAAPAIGAATVPLSPLLMPAGLTSLLKDSGAKCLISQRSMVPILEAVRDQLPPLLDNRMLLVDGAQRAFADYPAMLQMQPDVVPPVAVGGDTLFNIMYSSGTTGLPKGIMLSHFVRAMYCLQFASACRMTPESRVLHAGSVIFNGAFLMLMPAFYLGARYILCRQFDPKRVIELIERERVTHLTLVPSQIVALLNSPAFAPERLASLEALLSLGAPLYREHKERLNSLLPDRFYELYGLTEGFFVVLDRADAVRKLGSVGAPTPLYQMRILRDDGTQAEPGEVGEITGRGPTLTAGYWGRPDLTAQAIRDGWLHSGDMGYVDEEGFLYLVDRKKDMIDSGGVKVYPRDIEEVAARHPAVREVAVFGIPHEKWGETPLAAVVLREPGAVTADELREWINANVAARYQRVHDVAILPDFPRNAAGKTLKRELRDPYWAAHGRKI